MLTRKETAIMDLFRRRLFDTFTISEISKMLGGASYPWTFNAVKALSKAGILNIGTKGHSKIVELNLESTLAIRHLSLLDELEAEEKNIPNIGKIFDMTGANTAYFTLIIGGSYASGTQTRDSDLDIVVLVDDKADTKAVMNTLKNKGGLMVPEVHPYVFTGKDFSQMLLAKEENYGKLLFRKRLIYFGAESYYLIVKDAKRHGFTG